MKMCYLEVLELQDIECCGVLEYYDKVFDCIIMRSEKLLWSIKCIFYIVIIIDDFVICKLVKIQGNVFVIDVILVMLMSCICLVYFWDIVVQRVGFKFFFDKRDNFDFDFLIVSEIVNEFF